MYNYHNEKANLFTEEGLSMFVTIRDKAKALLKSAGAFSMGSAITRLCGSTWTMMACVDHMVALKEIREVTKGDVAGQHRVFVESYR